MNQKNELDFCGAAREVALCFTKKCKTRNVYERLNDV